MCKFNNRLFVFSFICLLGVLKVCVLAKPTQEPQQNDDFNQLMAITALLAPQDNYDLHYDQRQKGEENYRLKLDGFVIGLPQEESSALLVLTDDIFENISEFGITNSRNKFPSPSISSLKSPERFTSSSTLDSAQELSNLPRNNSLKKSDVTIVEIPAPKKPSNARHLIEIESQDEYSKNPESRTRSYLFHLVNLFKRGRKN